MFQNRYCKKKIKKNPFPTAVETRSEKKKERERQRGIAYETDTDLAQCPIHNEHRPTLAQPQHTIPHNRDQGRPG